MKKVLVVDDDEKTRYILRRVLEAKGYEVLEATNGVEGLMVAKENHPDIIVSDILMPQMDGFSFCRECKRDEQLRAIPFVFLSGTYTDKRDEDLGYQVGAVRYIVKPVEPDALVATIEEILEAPEDARPQQTVTPPSEATFYRLYNETLIRKLEDKMEELAVAYKTLAESERRFRLLAENAPDIIYRCELYPQCRFTYLSPATKQILGFAPEEFYANPDLMTQQVVPEDRPLLESLLRCEVEAGKPVVLRFRRKDGTLVWTETLFVPIRDDEGKLVAIEGVTRDITAQKEAEKLQEELNYAQKMETIGRMAGGLAHDYNNMLSVILGYAEKALKEVPAGTPVHDYLKEIQEAGRRSAIITSQLLTFAKRQPVEPKVLDVNSCIEKTLSMLKSVVGEGIQIVWAPDPNLLLVKIDEGQLTQLVVNLCLNARDAVGSKGKIVVETHSVTLDECELAGWTGLTQGDYCLITVKDNGCGMDDDTMKRIFEPFFTTKEKGLGLGMSSVYGIVKQNKGLIRIESKKGEGTTVYVWFPRVHGVVEPLGTTTNATKPSVSGHETILLVEDEQPLLKLLLRTLEGSGYKVLPASSPLEALELAKDYGSKIQLLVTDAVMPHIGGMELFKKLRTRYPSMKVLVMSGFGIEDFRSETGTDSPIAFLQKPFSLEDFLEKVRTVLGGA